MSRFKANMAENNLVSNLTAYLLDKLTTDQITVVCIGSDKYTGDCLGPLIGTMLTEANVNWNVLGTLDSPVHAGNLVDVTKSIPPTNTVIALDACLGKLHEVGNIECWEGSIKPGIAVGNKLADIGDIALFGIVAMSSSVGIMTLQSTPLSRVMKLSKIIAESLIAAHDAMYCELRQVV